MKKVILIALFLKTAQLFCQTTISDNYIAVIGEARSTFVPDMITFNFSLNVTEKKQAEAVEKLNSQANLFIDKVSSLGINTKEIKLENFSLNEAFDYSGEKIKSIGYQASENFELEIKYSEKDFNMFIDSISGTKFANLSFTYNLTFSDSLRNKIKNELICQASDNAFQIAQTLAKSRNLELGDIYSIEYTENIAALYGEMTLPPPPPPPTMVYAAKMEISDYKSRISLKGIETTQQVRIIIRIKNAR
jgi:uncharacterized protein YggE